MRTTNKRLGCPGNFAMRLSDSMPLAFGHNAITLGGLGAEPITVQAAREAVRRINCASNLRQFHFDFRSDREFNRDQLLEIQLVNICPTSTKRLGYHQNPFPDLDEAKMSSSNTIQFVEDGGGTQSGLWISSVFCFNEQNARSGETLRLVRKLIEYQRHSDSLANYLYFDGHVQTIPAQAIEEWCQRGWDFLDVGAAAFSE